MSRTVHSGANSWTHPDDCEEIGRGRCVLCYPVAEPNPWACNPLHGDHSRCDSECPYRFPPLPPVDLSIVLVKECGDCIFCKLGRRLVNLFSDIRGVVTVRTSA